MSNSQNKKNEQQNNLCTTLTEQWKKGELEEYKKYYCKTKWFEDIFQARCYNKDTKGEWWCLENEKYRYNNIYHTKDIEVLAPVPSYEEYSRLEWYAGCGNKENRQLRKWCEEFNALEVAKENQQLKEEIKMLKEVIYDLDGLECPKCGNYHRRGWTCSQCGYGK